MTPRLTVQRFLDEGPADAARIERFVSEHDFPIVEGDSVTFAFVGPADRVALRHWIYGLPSSQPFHRAPESDFWYLTQQIPPCSRIEYKIERKQGDRRELLMDPLNPRLAHDPFGANSVCYGQGYETPEWVRRDPEARPGAIEERTVSSDALQGDRRLLVYLPARFRRNRRYPLLVVHDGTDYLRYSDLQTVLDNLIHREELPPVIVALTQSPDRLRDYAADDRHARYLTEELVPLVESTWPLISRPEARTLMGASFGAVATLHAAWRYPGFFGRLALQSGSFAFSDIGEHSRGPLFDPVVDFVNAFREEPGRPTNRVFLSCGIYESLIYENRTLVPVLQATGMMVRYVEARDGHNWDNWRDRLREGLSWLMPGPLWMVYE